MKLKDQKAAKQQLRASLILRRHSLTSSEATAAGINLAYEVCRIITQRDVQIMHVYTPLLTQREIDTRPIIELVRKKLPNVKVDPGVVSKIAPFPHIRYDLIIVPTIGYDAENYRLGAGGGWYDRWLKQQPQAYKVGLAYRWAKQSRLPREAHDVQLSRVLEYETRPSHVSSADHASAR